MHDQEMGKFHRWWGNAYYITNGITRTEIDEFVNSIYYKDRIKKIFSSLLLFTMLII